MNGTRSRGFSLAELVVAIVFVGVVLGPFLLFVGRIQDLNAAMGQQGRLEGWRSFNDQAIACGIEPARAPGLATGGNPAIPAAPPLNVETGPVVRAKGRPTIVPLRAAPSAMAESRLTSAGFQIGASDAAEPRSTPLSPLVPIVMPLPVVTPADGTVVSVSALAAAAPGEPYTADVQAASSPGTSVILALSRPYATERGSGLARKSVTAVDLATGVSGVAWSEYPGAASAGDRSVALGDGRTRWLVTRADRRVQIYEPSPTAPFAYRLGVGAPSLRWGALEYPPGAQLSFDYSNYMAVQKGTVALQVDFPASVKAVFGPGWAALGIGFACQFNALPAPFSGDLSSFFQPDALAGWSDSVTVSATPVVPRSVVGSEGAWMLGRQKTALGVPLLSSAADAGGFYSPGNLHFTAPPGPDGTPIGRLSFDGGTILSTGPTLDVPARP